MHLPILSLGFINNLFGPDGLVLLVLGLLLFGRRLPEVGKNLGKTIVEFKKGLNGTYSEETPAAQGQEEAEAERPAPKRLASGSRVSVSQPVRRRLQETEEV